MQLHHDLAELHHSVYSLVEWKRDRAEMLSRASEEQFSFFTKTLPSLGKALDRALQGDVPLEAPAFKKRRGTKIPKFLGSLFTRVLDDTGFVRSDPDILVLKGMRSILYFVYKLELPYDEKTEKSVLESFIQTEEELLNLQFPAEYETILDGANLLVRTVLNSGDMGGLKPNHGPGAVATGESPSQKGNFARRYYPLLGEFPLPEYFFLGSAHMRLNSRQVDSLIPLHHGIAKVILVPKDSRGPRIISAEPLEFQFVQQSLKDYLVPLLERHPLTGGQVNFTCQDINRSLSLIGSSPSGTITMIDQRSLAAAYPNRHKPFKRVRRRDWVTLDMKDASDRVSLKLVHHLFEGCDILPKLIASRTSYTRLPGGRLVKQAKFAPMGSALCFPVEALCFFALAVSCLYHTQLLSWAQACKRVYVYGDDIICLLEDYERIQAAFEAVGLKVNQSKCCVSGLFRESCGCDAFNGVDVTPIRLRKTWSHRGASNAKQLVSYVSLSNSLCARGYARTAEYVRRLVESLYGPLPNVSYSLTKDMVSLAISLNQRTRVIGFYRPCEPLGYSNPMVQKRCSRWNKDLQRSEVFGPFIAPYLGKYRVNDYNELFRYLSTGAAGARFNRGIYPVPHRSRLKRGWDGVQ